MSLLYHKHRLKVNKRMYPDTEDNATHSLGHVSCHMDTISHTYWQYAMRKRSHVSLGAVSR